MIDTANETFGICCQYSAVLGLLSIPLLFVWKGLVDVWHRGRKWVKKAGVSALVVPALCLFGTVKDAYPTREEKDLLRGIQAEEARERAICGGMLVGGGGVSASQAAGLDEVGLRSGGQPDLAGFETITSTNTTRTLTAEDFERGFVIRSLFFGKTEDFRRFEGVGVKRNHQVGSVCLCPAAGIDLVVSHHPAEKEIEPLACRTVGGRRNKVGFLRKIHLVNKFFDSAEV